MSDTLIEYSQDEIDEMKAEFHYQESALLEIEQRGEKYSADWHVTSTAKAETLEVYKLMIAGESIEHLI